MNPVNKPTSYAEKNMDSLHDSPAADSLPAAEPSE